MCKIPNERIQQRAHVGAPKQSAPIRTKLMVGIFLITLGVDIGPQTLANANKRTKRLCFCFFYEFANCGQAKHITSRGSA